MARSERGKADLSADERKRRRGRLHIGTSGFHYAHWNRVFYPADLNKKDWFGYYAAHFDTVEINNTFYRLPPAHVFDAWRQAAPSGFCYAVKFSRYATHFKRLIEPAEPIGRFLKHAEKLGPALGPILVQLPPHWRIDLDRLAGFVTRLPRAHRWAIEFRDPSWLREPTYDLLQRHNVALCVHDMIANHPRRITADFIYLRFHGRRYAGSYTPQVLSAHARRIRGQLADAIDVYAYFNNDQHGYAVENSLALRRYLGAPGGRAPAASAA